MFPNIIIEGIGGSGKTTISDFIQEYYQKNNQKFVLYHFKYPKGESNIEKYGYQHGQFDLLFETIEKYNKNEIAVILDRSWIGEYVWGLIYRNMYPTYLPSLEERYKHLNNVVLNIYSQPETILQRLIKRNPDISKDDPFFKLYDNPIDAIKFINCQFETEAYKFIDSLNYYNINTDTEFDNYKGNQLIEIIKNHEITSE